MGEREQAPDGSRRGGRPPRPIGRDMSWLFLTSVRDLLAITPDDRDQAEPGYRALLPFRREASRR